MEQWKTDLYRNYTSEHTSFSSGKESIARIQSQGSVWRRYYGHLLPERRDAVILDCAAGSGGLIYWLRSLGYVNVRGVDLSVEQVDEAKRLGIEGVMIADAFSFLKDVHGMYDCIFAIDFIEHLPKPEALEALKLFYKALAPGGTLVLRTPSGESPFGARYRYSDLSHEVVFTRTSMHHALLIAGFHTVSFSPTGPVPHGIVSLGRLIAWKCIEQLLRLYLLIETGAGDGIFTQNMVVGAMKQRGQ